MVHSTVKGLLAAIINRQWPWTLSLGKCICQSLIVVHTTTLLILTLPEGYADLSIIHLTNLHPAPPGVSPGALGLP